MCGICGKVSPVGVRPEEIQKMLQAIAHRGPDDEGTYVQGVVGLGNRRLSIIDLAGGRQPICNEDESIRIVFNGEIYNYRALRRELEQSGHQFRTRSDTEVILHLYEDLGERCVERLKGMFAFAIWDNPRRRLVLARDHLGQKPMFYAHEGDDFLFASEIKAILRVRRCPPEMDWESVHHYLSLRFVPPPRTMLKNIRKLPAGHILVFQDGEIRITRYWQLSFRKKLDLGESEFLDELRSRLTETIAAHMISDVPIGAFLSGGLDSSMIVAIMAKELGASVRTFSIGVEEHDFDETPFARMVAKHYHTDHLEERVQADLIRSLPDMVWHLDEPSDPVAACMFQAARLAARNVKVVLGGDGGDELFAGFDRYRGNSYIQAYQRIPSFLREHLIGPVLCKVPDSFTYKSTSQKIRWVHELSTLQSPGERYAGATSFFRFNQRQKKDLYSPPLWGQLGGVDSAAVLGEQYDRADAADPVDRMLFTDYMTRLPEHSLMLTDRMTMAHGLEARSPFLDHDLVEYLAAFPSYLKIRGRTTKHLLRRLAEEYLPRPIVHREKQGFVFPIAYWFRNELHPFLHRFLLDSQFVHQGMFRRAMLESLLLEHRENRIDHHVRLWMLLNLEIWHRIYIQDCSPGAVQQHMFASLF